MILMDKFQELVLQQLQVINNRLGNLEEGQQELQKDVRVLQVGQQELQKDVRVLQVGQLELRKDVRVLQVGQQELQQGQLSLQRSLVRLEHEHGEKLSSLQLSLVRMEHEHGEKFSALFEGQKLLADKLDDNTSRLERIEKKVVGHDNRIELLDRTKANKRKSKFGDGS